MPTYWIVNDEGGHIVGMYLNHDDAHEDVKREKKELEWQVQGFELLDRPQWPTWRAIEMARLQERIIINGDEIDRLTQLGKLKYMPNKHKRLRHEIRLAKTRMGEIQKELKEFRLNKAHTFDGDESSRDIDDDDDYQDDPNGLY